jgi:hypothetical protein
MKNKSLEFKNLQKQVHVLIDLLNIARKVRAKNTNLPDTICAHSVHQLENDLRNTFGLLYIQAPFLHNIAQRRAIAALREKVRVVMPEYVQGFGPPEFDPEAKPETVPANW